MRLLATFISFLATQSTTSTQPATSSNLPLESICRDHKFKDGCAPLPFICQIRCVTDAGARTCERVDGAEDYGVTCDEALVEASFDGADSMMESSDCEAQCLKSKDQLQAESAHRCRFWRFEGGGLTQKCSLMSDYQCLAYDGCSADSHCKMGEQACPTDSDPVAPSSNSCEGPIEFNDKREIHWSCRTAEGDHLSAYSPLETLPHGAICVTNPKCADWMEETVDDQVNILQVRCANGDWIPDNTEGDHEDYKAVLGDSLASKDPILEPPCTGGGAILEIAAAGIDAPGANLICQTPLGEAEGTPLVYTVPAPNSCILLCDNQLGWTLESNLDSDGIAKFAGDMGEFDPKVGGPSNVQFTDQVKCW